jgi:hypothetical protein
MKMNLKKLFLGTALAACVASVASADSLQIASTGASTVTVAGSGSGTTMYANSNFNGWNILITFGSSNSPSLTPYGLDLTAVVTCSAGATCTANPLDIFYSDTNFNVPVAAGSFQDGYSATISGTGTGTTSEIGWANSGNTLFGLGLANKIGSTVGPFSSTAAGTTLGGPASAGPYSLTIEDIFTASSGPVSFSTDASVTATPEPSEALMLGTGLLSLLGLVRRKAFNIA